MAERYEVPKVKGEELRPFSILDSFTELLWEELQRREIEKYRREREKSKVSGTIAWHPRSPLLPTSKFIQAAVAGEEIPGVSTYCVSTPEE